MKNPIPYASRYMPDTHPSVDENGLVTDQKMVDHMMSSAKITRTQALIVMNCLYQTLQNNLCVGGQARFKDLFSINLIAENAKPVKRITTTNGVARRYKAKGPTVKLRPVPADPLVKLVISEKDLKKKEVELDSIA